MRERKHRASNLLRVISTLHPIPPEPTARLQSTGELSAGVRRRATVASTPDRFRSTPFGSAAVEDTETAAGDLQKL